jgi:hypothetical protein
MRTWTLALAAAIVLGPTATRADPPDAPAKAIRAAADALLEGTARGPGEPEASLTRLVDEAARITDQAALPSAAKARIDAVRSDARRYPLLDDRARRDLAEAYAALNAGRAFEFPKSVASIDQAKAFGRGQVNRALAALAASQGERAARELIGFVLLVVTPMEASE